MVDRGDEHTYATLRIPCAVSGFKFLRLLLASMTNGSSSTSRLFKIAVARWTVLLIIGVPVHDQAYGICVPVTHRLLVSIAKDPGKGTIHAEFPDHLGLLSPPCHCLTPSIPSFRGTTRGRSTQTPVGEPSNPSIHRRYLALKVPKKAEGLCSSPLIPRTGVHTSPPSASRSPRPCGP